jgi:hypothetical protein
MQGFRPQALEIFVKLPVLTRVPPPLANQMRGKAVSDLAYALATDETGGSDTALPEAIHRVSSRLGQALPTHSDIARARQKFESVVVDQRGHWPLGWSHYLGSGAPRAADEPNTISEIRARAEEALALADSWSATVSERTGMITHILKEWAKECGWRPYRELGIPVVTDAHPNVFGRLDLVIFRPEEADLVIEIDSAPNPDAAQKLVFARDAGAFSVWLRWHKGRAAVPDGIRGVDLVMRNRLETT